MQKAEVVITPIQCVLDETFNDPWMVKVLENGGTGAREIDGGKEAWLL